MRVLHCREQDADRPDPQYHHGRTPRSGCTGTTSSHWIGLMVVGGSSSGDGSQLLSTSIRNWLVSESLCNFMDTSPGLLEENWKS